MSDVLLLLVASVAGFVAGAAWMWRIVHRAIAEVEREWPMKGLIGSDARPSYPGRPEDV